MIQSEASEARGGTRIILSSGLDCSSYGCWKSSRATSWSKCGLEI